LSAPGRRVTFGALKVESRRGTQCDWNLGNTKGRAVVSELSTTFMAPRHVEWSERLSVGVDEIDEQHRELYRRIDMFLRALTEKRGKEELRPLVAYLEQYVREHFAAEQQMMELSGYAHLGDHMIAHHWFEDEYRRLVERLDGEGVTFGIARGLVELLVSWLDTHLETTDRRFGTYLVRYRLRGRGAPSA
jgi:hemerythrin